MKPNPALGAIAAQANLARQVKRSGRNHNADCEACQ